MNTLRYYDDGGGGPIRARCPRCGWTGGGPYWQCDACQAVFDTFLTRATCPKCRQSWKDTACPGCRQRSPHDDWYSG